jgi:hypothetical protein
MMSSYLRAAGGMTRRGRGEIRVGRTSTLTQRSREWPSTASIALAKVIRHIPAHPVSVSWPRPVRKKRTGVACCMCWTAPRCAIAEHHNVVGQQARDEQQQQRDRRTVGERAAPPHAPRSGSRARTAAASDASAATHLRLPSRETFLPIIIDLSDPLEPASLR